MEDILIPFSLYAITAWFIIVRNKLVVMRDYFLSPAISYQRPSTAVQLTNQLLHFWNEGGYVYYKRVCSLSFLVAS